MSVKVTSNPQQVLMEYALKELTQVITDIQSGKVPNDPKKLKEIYAKISIAQKELQEKKITEEELEKTIEEEAKKVK